MIKEPTILTLFVGNGHSQILIALQEYGVYDIWSEIRTGTPIDIMVAPKAQEAFTSELTEKGKKWAYVYIVKNKGIHLYIQG